MQNYLSNFNDLNEISKNHNLNLSKGKSVGGNKTLDKYLPKSRREKIKGDDININGDFE